jgi:hypothetical protein
MRALPLLLLVTLLATTAPRDLFAESSTASTADALAVARDLFAVTFDRAGVQLNAQAVEHTWPSLENALRTRNPLLESTALGELRREFERIRLEKLRALVKDAPAIYARHLTPEEMREIAAFYRSPTGTRLMQVVPSAVGGNPGDRAARHARRHQRHARSLPPAGARARIHQVAGVRLPGRAACAAATRQGVAGSGRRALAGRARTTTQAGA